MNKKFLLLAALILAVPAWAADERAKTDRSTRTHTLLVVDSVTGEIRQLKSGPGGLQVESTASASSQNATEPVVVSVGTTPTLLVAASSTTKSVIIQNSDTVSVFVGKAAVTTATGIILAGGLVANDGLGVSATAIHGDDIYAIVTAGTADVRVQVVSN